MIIHTNIEGVVTAIIFGEQNKFAPPRRVLPIFRKKCQAIFKHILSHRAVILYAVIPFIFHFFNTNHKEMYFFFSLL